MMSLFKRKNQTNPFPLEQYEPVLRCSICTGEQTACMRNRATGKLTELMLIRSPADLDLFRVQYHLGDVRIEKIY